MTVTVWSASEKSGETQSAKNLRQALLTSEPELAHPDVKVEIISDLPLPGRQIDIVVLYHDCRGDDSLLKTDDGTLIHSFVQIIEVKNHSPDDIGFQGPNLCVRYDGRFHNATEQCDQQTFAFKKFQASSVRGNKRLYPVFVQRAIWLARVPEASCPETPEESSVPVLYAELTWSELVRRQERKNKKEKRIQAFYGNVKYHSLETLRSRLTHKVTPTKQDLRRVNALTKMRFDEEKTQYITNLGTGLLLLRGRGGTGKTMSLIQIGLHLARQKKKSVIITYNHSLISDISRMLYLIGEYDPAFSHSDMPVIKTRYAFIQDLYIKAFGTEEEIEIRRAVGLDHLEDARLKRLLKEPATDTLSDFVLVDEGQDWKPEHRDLLFKIFGPEQTVVADGVDQFVGNDRCKWDIKEIPINRRHGLKFSRRTKGATCQVVGEVAKEFGIQDWDLEPDPKVHGGRFTVVLEPNAKTAVNRILQLLDNDLERTQYVRPSDNLVCLPSTAMTGGMNYEALFDRSINDQGKDSWRGFDEEDRRQYLRKHEQLKAVRYNSCRGMEGWTTICLGLDTFFDFQRSIPKGYRKKIEDEIRSRDGLLFSQKAADEEIEKRRLEYAVNWLMIPLTRSIDHLIVHIKDENSMLAGKLKTVSNKSPGVIQWI